MDQNTIMGKQVLGLRLTACLEERKTFLEYIYNVTSSFQISHAIETTEIDVLCDELELIFDERIKQIAIDNKRELENGYVSVVFENPVSIDGTWTDIMIDICFKKPETLKNLLSENIGYKDKNNGTLFFDTNIILETLEEQEAPFELE